MEFLIAITVLVVVYLVMRKPRTAAPAVQATPAKTQGEFSLQAVGESHYQRALEDACGGRTEESAEHECTAHLVPENSNKYDDQAVRVEVGGSLVGYLARADAREYRAVYGEAITSCPALIVGGWDNEEDGRGHFGIKLDVDLR